MRVYYVMHIDLQLYRISASQHLRVIHFKTPYNIPMAMCIYSGKNSYPLKSSASACERSNLKASTPKFVLYI